MIEYIPSGKSAGACVIAARITGGPVEEVSFHSSSVQSALRCIPRNIALSLTTL
jgi:hypothetical protein